VALGLVAITVGIAGFGKVYRAKPQKAGYDRHGMGSDVNGTLRSRSESTGILTASRRRNLKAADRMQEGFPTGDLLVLASLDWYGCVHSPCPRPVPIEN